MNFIIRRQNFRFGIKVKKDYEQKLSHNIKFRAFKNVFTNHKFFSTNIMNMCYFQFVNYKNVMSDLKMLTFLPEGEKKSFYVNYTSIMGVTK